MSKASLKVAKNASTSPETGQKQRVKGAGNHPNSRKNLRPVPWSSDHQPATYRGPGFGMFKTALLAKLSQKSRIIVEGKDIISGNPVKIYVDNPNMDVIITQWLRQAAKGNMKAVELLAERIDGKVALPIMKAPEDDGTAQKERVIVLANGNTLTM